jgi:hypothetical protein
LNSTICFEWSEQLTYVGMQDLTVFEADNGSKAHRIPTRGIEKQQPIHHLYLVIA